MDAALIAVLITMAGDIYAKWRASRADKAATASNQQTMLELRNVVLELKGLHEITARRVDVVEQRLAFLEAKDHRWATH